MLKEFNRLRQEPGGYRRLFTDSFFELWVWYDRQGGHITGFQLCYDIQRDKRALTWIDGKGFLHSRVDEDEGYRKGGKKSPILVPDGAVDRDRLADLFRFAGRRLERSVSDLVYEKISLYTRDAENPLL
jgi:hypothetical protein